MESNNRWDAMDHPRMRGEDLPCPGVRISSTGSPPHARGRRVRRYLFASVFGITPACAGKTFESVDSPEHPAIITPACAGKTLGDDSPVEKIGDHPRMRGEDFVWACGCVA